MAGIVRADPAVKLTGMKTKGQAGAALIDDRRKPPAPKMAYLAHFEKLILNPPWLTERKDRAPGSSPASRQPPIQMTHTGYDATAARKKIGERYTRSLKGYHPPAPRRSGV
jgi:hypothetical protein